MALERGDEGVRRSARIQARKRTLLFPLNTGRQLRRRVSAPRLRDRQQQRQQRAGQGKADAAEIVGDNASSPLLIRGQRGRGASRVVRGRRAEPGTRHSPPARGEYARELVTFWYRLD